MHRLQRAHQAGALRSGGYESVLTIDSHMEHMSVLFTDALMAREKVRPQKFLDEFQVLADNDRKLLPDMVGARIDQVQRVKNVYLEYLDLFRDELLPSLDRGPDRARDAARMQGRASTM